MEAAAALLHFEEEEEEMDRDASELVKRKEEQEDEKFQNSLDRMAAEIDLSAQTTTAVKGFLKHGGMLRVFVLQCENLLAKETCITGKHGKKKHFTKTVKKTNSPTFNEMFVFTIKPQPHRKDETLRLRVYDCSSLLGSAKFMGEVCIPLEFLLQLSQKSASITAFQEGEELHNLQRPSKGVDISAWFYFGNKLNLGKEKSKDDRGRVRLKISIGGRSDKITKQM